MSRLCGRTTAHNLAERAQNLEMRFFLCIFLRKIFKSKVLTAQENLLLEGLVKTHLLLIIFLYRNHG